VAAEQKNLLRSPWGGLSGEAIVQNVQSHVVSPECLPSCQSYIQIYCALQNGGACLLRVEKVQKQAKTSHYLTMGFTKQFPWRNQVARISGSPSRGKIGKQREAI